MKDKTLVFQEHYKKLDKPEFTTLRNSDKNLKKNDIIVVRTPRTAFKARVTWCRKIPLEFIKDDVLCADTDTNTREEALTELRRFYPDLTEETWVKFMYIRRKDVDDAWREKKHAKKEYKKNV